jgi:hypothetical protein
MIYDREKLYSANDLRERSWTDTAMKRFLPATPDDTRPNPHYSKAGAPMKFWLRSRVHRVEKTKRFLAWQARIKERRAAAQRAVATRTSRMQENMETAELTIQRGWTDEHIRKLAVRTHGGNYAGDPGPFQWSKWTARNCVRHNLTNYEQLWKRINRGQTGQRAYEILRERVDELIDEAYPQFREADESE